MQRACDTCGESFDIHADEEAFLQKIGWKFAGGDVHPELPTQCPVCRSRLRVTHRNERYLYRNTSAMSGEGIISIFSPEPTWGEPYKVYSQDEWRSDKWDPLTYGCDFDFDRPFFDQWAQLHKAVPRMAVTTLANENADYTTGTAYSRNCYLINSSEYAEDCYYGKLFQTCKNCVDCSYIYNSELCYECFSVSKCYGCQYVTQSQNCSDCFFSSNLRGCKNCCLCTNLDHKEYYFLNQPLSQKEYEKRMAEFRGQHALTREIRRVRDERRQAMINKYANIVNSEGCTGDYIEGSKDCTDCYDVSDSRDCRNVFVGVNVKDVYDCSNMYVKPELCYQILGTIETFNCAYCIYVFHSQNLLYCEYCFNCSDCFGCNGLTRKKYCVFNKQYTKEEYEDLVPRIIEKMREEGSWSKFFPAQLSPFGYNESVAQEYYPLSKNEASSRGYFWHERGEKNPKKQTYTLPNSVADVTDDIVEQALECESCKQNYKIIPQELAFYRQNTVSVPRQCPDCRYDVRAALRNPRTLWNRDCMKCGKAISTTYSPNRPEIVYCEACYRKEVY
jgi:uncharacterized protein YbaR (Trm112 family)